MKNNTIITSIFILGVIVLIAVLSFVFKKPEETPEAKITPPPNYVINPSPSPTTQLPDKFLVDFPLEAGAVIDNGYNVSSPDNFQSTVHFESRQSLDQNFKIYNNYLNRKNGWIVQNILNNPSVKLISAVNTGGTTVTVAIAQNITTKISQVTISFVYAN